MRQDRFDDLLAITTEVIGIAVLVWLAGLCVIAFSN